MDVSGSECDTVPQEPSTDPELPRPPPAKSDGPTGTAGDSTSIPSSSHSSSTTITTTSISGIISSSRSGLGGVSIVSSSAEGAGESSMQFSTRPPSAEQPGFMGTWQQQSTDSNLLYRMSQQVRQLRLILSPTQHLHLPLLSPSICSLFHFSFKEKLLVFVFIDLIDIVTECVNKVCVCMCKSVSELVCACVCVYI